MLVAGRTPAPIAIPPHVGAGGQPTPRRVLHLVDTLGVGGAETWLIELLRHWSKTGAVRSDVIATSGCAGVFDAEAQALGAAVKYVRFSRGRLPSFALEFRRILREGRYDAIHDHQDYASGWHFLIGLGRLPATRITHVHNPAYQIRQNYGVTSLRRMTSRVGRGLVARLATHVGGTSRQVLSEYGFDARTFQATPRLPLYCGFEPSRFLGDPAAAKARLCGELGWPNDSRIVLFAGRIDRSPDATDPQTHKNSAFAVDVAIACARREPRVRAIFAGAPSPATAVLQRRIAEAGLQDRIRLLGVRRDVAQLMLGADALLFPSRAEGLGMVAVEAQAAGLPVLASTAVPDECVVVRDLVQFMDVDLGPEPWADALPGLMKRPRAVAPANSAVSESAFAIARSAAALEELYGGRTSP
jgi:glycosyltransferase EpsF